jgi:serine-type D-Ala-D-Ala carboxypeptidase
MSMPEQISDSVSRALADGQIPGAVVLVGCGAEVLYHEAFGDRMLAPERRPMLPDTIFDCASVTKPVATATALMQLVEQGKLSVEDRVNRWLPQMPPQVTLRHLLTHSSGIPSYKNYLREWGDTVSPEERRARVVRNICILPPAYRTGHGFAYSCLGFICLTSIIEMVAGVGLEEWTREHLTKPLGLRDTGFCPSQTQRCAATEQYPEGVLCGVVHDENARYLGGVGGNAGLFSTAPDLARFMAMILNGGELDGVRILRPESVAAMTSPQLKLPRAVRGLGWDIDSTYSAAPRGGFPLESFGHTGFTGTSIWADPKSRVYVIILTNRVHLGRDMDVAGLRREIAETVAAELI